MKFENELKKIFVFLLFLLFPIIINKAYAAYLWCDPTGGCDYFFGGAGDYVADYCTSGGCIWGNTCGDPCDTHKWCSPASVGDSKCTNKCPGNSCPNYCACSSGCCGGTSGGGGDVKCYSFTPSKDHVLMGETITFSVDYTGDKNVKREWPTGWVFSSSYTFDGTYNNGATYKAGDTLKFTATAQNSDGTEVNNCPDAFVTILSPTSTCYYDGCSASYNNYRYDYSTTCDGTTCPVSAGNSSCSPQWPTWGCGAISTSYHESDCSSGDDYSYDCKPWTAGSCGGGTCSTTQRQYTRDSGYNGCCTYRNKCVEDSSCSISCTWDNCSTSHPNYHYSLTSQCSLASCPLSVGNSSCIPQYPSWGCGSTDTTFGVDDCAPGDDYSYDCRPWTAGSCGGGTCSNAQRQYTRDSGYNGCCSYTNKCELDSTCTYSIRVYLDKMNTNLSCPSNGADFTAGTATASPVGFSKINGDIDNNSFLFQGIPLNANAVDITFTNLPTNDCVSNNKFYDCSNDASPDDSVSMPIRYNKDASVTAGSEVTLSYGLGYEDLDAWITSIDGDIFASPVSSSIPCAVNSTLQGNFTWNHINVIDTATTKGYSFSTFGIPNTESPYLVSENGGYAQNLQDQAKDKFLDVYSFEPPGHEFVNPYNSPANPLLLKKETNINTISVSDFNASFADDFELEYNVAGQIWAVLFVESETGDPINISGPIVRQNTNANLLIITNTDVNISKDVYTEFIDYSVTGIPTVDVAIISAGDINIEGNTTANDLPIMFLGPLIAKGQILVDRNLGSNNDAYPAVSFKYDPNFLYQLTEVERQSNTVLNYTGISTFYTEWDYGY